MNYVMLIGRTGREPEIKNTPSGSKVVTLSLGVDRKGKDGKKETDWIDCTVWGKTADVVEQYVKKGEKVCVCGSLQTRTWQGQDGQNRKAYFVLVDRVELLGAPKPQNNEQSGDVPFEV